MSFFTESNMATSAYELETLEALLGKCMFPLLCWGNLSKSYKPPKVFPISRDMVVLSRPRYKVFVISKGLGSRIVFSTRMQKYYTYILTVYKTLQTPR